MEPLARATGLTKRFGTLVAVNGVDLSLGGGEVIGLLGANGAGKTTLIRLLLGLLPPTAGECKLFGTKPSLSSRSRVGYVPQTLGLYGDLSVSENWHFSARAYGVGARRLPDAFTPWSDVPAGRLPIGVQRRVAFGLAQLHRPELFILDEPTSGVGPLGRSRLWDDVRRVADDGAGVLVTTHNLEEAEQCDRLLIMRGGAVVASGTAQVIMAGHTVTEVKCHDPLLAYRALDDDRFAVQLHGTTLRVAGHLEVVQRRLSELGLEAAARTVPASLEETFVDIVTASENA